MQMSWRLLIAALLSTTGICSCVTAGTGAQPSANSQLPTLSGDSFSGVIVPAGHFVTGAWTPSEADVLRAEPTIQRCIVAQRHDLRRTLSRFVRQYSGDTLEGRRVLRVDLFDPRYHPIKNLRQAVTVVDASGDDYFMVEYVLESEKCTLYRY